MVFHKSLSKTINYSDNLFTGCIIFLSPDEEYQRNKDNNYGVFTNSTSKLHHKHKFHRRREFLMGDEIYHTAVVTAFVLSGRSI